MHFDYKKHRGWIENLSIMMQIGLTMAGCIVFCFFIGFYLDRWFGTRGVFVAVFILLGVVGGAVTVYRQIRDILHPKAKERSEEEEGP
jgi:F0F1-type ATP synthase assembly protein I